jgi:hypothetical protein
MSAVSREASGSRAQPRTAPPLSAGWLRARRRRRGGRAAAASARRGGHARAGMSEPKRDVNLVPMQDAMIFSIWPRSLMSIGKASASTTFTASSSART